MEDTLSKFMSESAKRHEENSNLIKEIWASTDAAIRNQGASIKTLEIQIEQVSKITLRVEEEKVVLTSVKPASSLIKRVYMLSLRERMKLDLEARFMGVTLVLNRSLDPFFEDYIKLNDLNEPIELRRYQGDDLMPTIEEGDITKEFRTRDEDLDTGIVYYLKNMDTYRDEGMGDVIFGELFLREVGIKARRFERMVTLYKDDKSVTYQMVRSHPRFNHHINEKSNKIPPLLKFKLAAESVEDEVNHTW
nr:hypothetical protein [Tanacetum cinerariifolium]